MPLTISFIIAVRDEPLQLLDATLDGLLETSARYRRQIIVVDDGSLIPLALERSEVLVVRHSTPVGSSRARRSGASFATGDVLVFLDPHMSFASDWLDRMLPHVGSGALLCAAWWDWELTNPVCWGAEFVWCGQRDYHRGLTPGFAFRHLTRFPGDGAVEVPMVIGACYMLLRQSYERIGGFSPFFRIWGKLEQDLCSRARILGLGVKCVTGARVGHFSRPKFPYPVRWDDIEFNQLVTLRTVFEEPIRQALEKRFEPLPNKVVEWLRDENFSDFRRILQSRRRISDLEFFRRFVSNAEELEECFKDPQATPPDTRLSASPIPAGFISA
ncbi:MAG TPA: glycosyltransferase [Bryobacteraceae bacterium]|jgi:glycosyltransferase involved in cell wall biosynthesis